MIVYKLFKIRSNGTIGPLFINKRQVIQPDRWYEAELHETKGFKARLGWHCTAKPKAPHLSTKGRAWYRVEINDYQPYVRPKSQGGMWYLAQWMKVIEPV